jgi:eukaryotic-like serine/threonine-protein kinase
VRAAELLAQATAEHSRDDWLEVLSSARTNAGRVLETRGDFVAARTLYESVLDTAQVLASRQPGDIQRQAELADAYDSLGKIALEQGQLAQAVADYRGVHRIKSELSSRRPDDRDAAEQLLISSAVLGRTLALCGSEAESMKHVSSAVQTARELVAFDAKQADWRFWLGKYSLQLGALARGSGLLQEAATHDGAALQVLSDLVATDGTNSAWQRELAYAQVESARLKMASDDMDSAAPLLDAAFAAIARENVAGRGDRNLRLLEAQARIVRGQLAAQLNEGAVARQQWIQARAAIAQDVSVGANPNFLATWASAQLLLGEPDVARPALEQLLTMGYYTPDVAALLTATGLSSLVTPAARRCGASASTAPVAGQIG